MLVLEIQSIGKHDNFFPKTILNLIQVKMLVFSFMPNKLDIRLNPVFSAIEKNRLITFHAGKPYCVFAENPTK